MYWKHYMLSRKMPISFRESTSEVMINTLKSSKIISVSWCLVQTSFLATSSWTLAPLLNGRQGCRVNPGTPNPLRLFLQVNRVLGAKLMLTLSGYHQLRNWTGVKQAFSYYSIWYKTKQTKTHQAWHQFWEMAQWIKCSPRKHKGLSSDPWHPCEK